MIETDKLLSLSIIDIIWNVAIYYKYFVKFAIFDNSPFLMLYFPLQEFRLSQNIEFYVVLNQN